MKKTFLLSLLAATVWPLAAQQRSDLIVELLKGDRPAIAIPDFRGSGDAQKHMAVFNDTLYNEIQGSGVFKVVSRSLLPRLNPQVPQDFKPAGRGSGDGYWMTDWSSPPVSANYLAFGYTGIQNNQLVLFGWLYNVQQTLASAQVIGKLYFGDVNDDGARKVAREFAADILKLMGMPGLAGTKIFFVSSRTGEKQIWMMDYDGSGQRQFAQYRDLCTMPSVSPDGSRIAFTTFTPNGPQILVHSTETGRRLPFLNPAASMNATLSFSPDGSKVIFASKVGGFAQLHLANPDGSGLQRLSNSRAIEVEPKINPKTGADVVLVSGRSGPPQIYKMSLDGADVTRLTPGEGQASNPSWHPDGKHIAFSWTRGYEPGNWNVFIMDVTTMDFVQLTHGRGRNENPSWAPDGRHIVFASNRNGTMQIYTMLADGTEVRQLTSAGRNEMPVWSR
ncbi:MAG: PD40 domain-containing protein [Acidobacteria bacterium]|nr:PD40 domain-containing protein [Acidobacteriota bacterium]